MPVADIAPPTAPAPAPTPAPAPSPAPDAKPEPKIPAGIDAAMKEFDEAVRPKPPKAPDKTPAPDKTEKAPDKPEPTPEDLWDKAPGKLKGEYYKTRRTFEEKVSGLEKEIATLKSKPAVKEGAIDPKMVEQYQTRIKEIEQQLAAADFQKSPEFKAKFIDRWTSEYNSTVSEVKQLMLTLKDADGNEKQRAATEQDFQKIMRLPAGEQDRVVSELFGTYSNRIFSRLFRLQEIERASTEAVQEHSQKAELLSKEKEATTLKEKQDYDQSTEVSNTELQQKWPQYFAKDEKDPEASQALDGGYKFVDDVLSKASSLSPSDRAAYNAVLRARAAAFPRMALQFNRVTAENESLKTELAKFRKSDPGSGDNVPNVPPKQGENEIPKGIEDAVSKLRLQ